MRHIGTVEVLRDRVYPLDTAMGHDSLATTVVVPPGAYPLYRDGDSRFFMLRGRINTGRMRRIGDGTFIMGGSDEAAGPEVQFPSKTFGPDEWAAFTAEDVCREGHPDQRIRVRVLESA